MKKIIGFFMCFIILAGMAMNTGAMNEKEKYQVEEEYALLYLQANGFEAEKLSNPIELYSFDDEIEAVCFTIDQTGYIIVNTNDLDIPEFSLEASSPYSNCQGKSLYNGPISYYDQVNDTIEDISTGKIVIDNEKLQVKYKKEKKDKGEILERIETYSSNNSDSTKSSIVSSFIENGNLSGTLRTWYSNRYCDVDGSAILLMYYDDYYSSSFVATSNQSNGTLQNFLVNNNYICDCPADANDVLYGYNGSTGLNNYLKKEAGFLYSGYYGVKSTYSWGYLQTLINANKPSMLGANSSHPDFGAHWIMPHGYYAGYDGVPYIICNNGFGNNNVYTSANYLYYTFGFVHLASF